VKVFIAKAVAWLIAAIAAFSSYGHQVTLLAMADLDPIFGIPGEWVTPLTVDSLAIIALVIRMSDDVTERTRKLALIPLGLAGGMAIAANVAIAHNVVQVIVGIWTVASYIIAEFFIGMVERKVKPEVDDETKAKRSAAARKAAVTRAKNKARTKRKPRVPASAPVSPATVAEIDSAMAEQA
jgi:hypothetical protein